MFILILAFYAIYNTRFSWTFFDVQHFWVETPKAEHPETTELPEEKDVHANHVEAFNSSIRRSLSAFRRRTNTYAKSVWLSASLCGKLC